MPQILAGLEFQRDPCSAEQEIACPQVDWKSHPEFHAAAEETAAEPSVPGSRIAA
jgi:hypothetical protein